MDCICGIIWRVAVIALLLVMCNILGKITFNFLSLYHKKNDGLKNGKEYILCAACWYEELGKKEQDVINACTPNNINKGVVFCGYRHAQCIYTMYSVTGLRQYQAGKEVQGFLTNKNRFVDREEAAKIAFESNQTKELKTRLFSEDLYL